MIIGILNLSHDSFSGAPADALRHAELLMSAGADIIDVGAEASNPDAKQLSADEEIELLSPIVSSLIKQNARISVDTYKARTMRAMIDLGVTMINDITALSDKEAIPLLQKSNVKIVLMHARNRGATAERAEHEGDVLQSITAALHARVTAAVDGGIARERLILDPGMGFFLDARPEPSLDVLRAIPRLRAEFRLPIYISTSRKSFIGTLLGGRTPLDRAAGTLATELFALHAGATYIRTHDPRALKDAWTLWSQLTQAERK